MLPFLILLAALPASAERIIVAVTVNSAIHPVTGEVIAHAIEAAGRQDAVAVLVRLNTPGGLLDATRHIVEQIVGSPVPVVTFVTPGGARAASAGFFLLQAGDVAAMAHGTNTGAASPVAIGGQMDPVMRGKVENDTAALVRSVASRRGRNSEAAEETVRKAASFTDREALSKHLIDLAVKDEADLIRQLDGRPVLRFNGTTAPLETAGARVVEYELTVRERLITALADPNLALIMLMLGGALLYFEFTVPGLIAPGVIGTILILLGGLALSILPISWGAVALLVVAVALFIAESQIASHGVLGLGGAVAMTLGALMLVDGPPELRIRLSTALAVSLPFAAIAVFLMSLAVKSRREPPATGISAMIHQTGVAYTDLTPEGKVFLRGEYWDAVASAPVDKGAAVRVKAIHGLKLEVDPVV